VADKYGYASEGESFTLTDPREAWVLEMIGKGPAQQGAVWMAVKIPGNWPRCNLCSSCSPPPSTTTLSPTDFASAMLWREGRALCPQQL
jgi:hypothetical protein